MCRILTSRRTPRRHLRPARLVDPEPRAACLTPGFLVVLPSPGHCHVATYILGRRRPRDCRSRTPRNCRRTSPQLRGNHLMLLLLVPLGRDRSARVSRGPWRSASTQPSPGGLFGATFSLPLMARSMPCPDLGVRRPRSMAAKYAWACAPMLGAAWCRCGECVTCSPAPSFLCLSGSLDQLVVSGAAPLHHLSPAMVSLYAEQQGGRAALMLRRRPAPGS